MRKINRRKIFFNVSAIMLLIVASVFVFPVITYHGVLFFLYSNTVEQVNPETDLVSKFLVLDTREPGEFEISHLENAKWVGFSEFDIKTFDQFPKDTAILVYCSIGHRSEKVGEQLIEAGFSNVKNLYGGIFEWKNKGFPVYRDAVKTDSVHTYGKGWGFFLRNGIGVLDDC